jgi:hypothetical protein
MDLEVYYVFTQLAIALAGFAGVMVVLDTKSVEFERLRLLALFHLAVMILIASIVPIFFQKLDMWEQTEVWKWSSAVLTLLNVSFNIVVIPQIIRFGKPAMIVINPVVTLLAWIIGYLGVIGVFLNFLQWPFSANEVIYLFHLSYGVVLTLLLFVDIVLRSVSEKISDN